MTAMLKSFVCPSHLSWLLADTSRLKSCYESSIEAGNLYFESSLWSDAIPRLGAAHQIADLLLTQSDVPVEPALEKFGYSSMMLLTAMDKAGFTAEAFEIYTSVLEKIESNQALPAQLKFSFLSKLHFYWSDTDFQPNSIAKRFEMELSLKHTQAAAIH